MKKYCFIFGLVACLSFPSVAFGQDVQRFLDEKERISEGVAMAIALSNIDVSTNRTFKASFATGLYDDAVALAVMVGYRPDLPGITLRSGFAYGVNYEDFSGTLGFAAHW